jgi:hypothetical protein
MQNSKLGTHDAVRIQMEFGMDGVDFLCGVPLWTSVFSVVKDFKTLTTVIKVFHGGKHRIPAATS